MDGTGVVAELVAGVVGGDRRALARAITLVESTRTDHRADADALLAALLPRTGRAIRIGISGPPGVGKSMLIEALGVGLVETGGHRVAVLAVDPSSTRSGGSILGDKTRMERLTRLDGAYVRPSPSSGVLGGVAPRTREAILVCEAAAFDVVLVETVGVGQSETEVDALVDVFVLLVAPGGGDELQGIKRGVMELADVVAVTKADGDLLGPARQAAADYRHALHLLPPKHPGISPEVLLTSTRTGEGIEDLWAATRRVHDHLAETGALERRRADQAVAWLWSEISHRLLRSFRDDPAVAGRLPVLEAQVRAGSLAPGAAVDELLSVSDDVGPERLAGG